MKLTSPSATKLLGSLALILLAGLGWLLLLSPQISALSEVRAEAETARTQNDAQRQLLVVLQGQQKHLSDTRATAAALAAKFPPTADQPELFRSVTAAAATAGIPAERITTLTPTAPLLGTGGPGGTAKLPGKAAAADVAAQSVSMTIEGSYPQMLQLIANLERMPRAYLISSMTLSAGTTPGTFSAAINGEMFVMPPAKDPASAGVESPGTPQPASK